MATRLEEYLGTALASVRDGVISTDADGRILFANKAALGVLRASESEIVGHPFDQVFRMNHESTHAPLKNSFDQVLSHSAQAGAVNHTILTAIDGAEIPIESSAAFIRGSGGATEGTVIVFRDITQRRQGEANTRLLASIVESSDDAIISKDVKGIVTSWNKGAERIFGYSADEAVGQPISMLAAPDRVDEMPRILERIRRGERIDHFETVRKAKDGRLLNISLTVSPLFGPEGEVIGASKVARDITEQVHFREVLAEQRERIRVTLSSIGDGVITTDTSGRVTFLNPVAERLTGWKSSEAQNLLLVDIFDIVNEDSRQRVENPASRVLVEGRVIGLANHTVLIARDGIERTIDDSAAPILNDRGEAIGVVLVFRDVTERRNATRQLERHATELRRTNDELSQFAYAVSHDLREPLRNIATFSELLTRQYAGGQGPDSGAYTGYVLNGVARMETLLDDLLAYSQVGGPQEQPPRIVDSNRIVTRVLQDLHSAILESGALVESEVLPPVYGHESQLVQLFQNLIGNAIKYRSADPPRIQIRAQNRDADVRFSVRDNGIGIAPQYQKTIFGVFKRLHGKDVPGTGIGLAICSKVVERHGGQIWVESQPGEGSEFFFTLPSASPGRIIQSEHNGHSERNGNSEPHGHPGQNG